MVGMLDNPLPAVVTPLRREQRVNSARNHQTRRSTELPGSANLSAALAAIPALPKATEPLWQILAAFSRERRWLAWITPPQRPSAAALAARGLDTTRVLVIQTRPGVDPLAIAERALASGNFTAVLVWPKTVDGERLARFQQAAISSQALGILFPPDPATVAE